MSIRKCKCHFTLFQCLGSAQHLKNRFGSGYTLTLRSDGRAESLGKLKELVVRN